MKKEGNEVDFVICLEQWEVVRIKKKGVIQRRRDRKAWLELFQKEKDVDRLMESEKGVDRGRERGKGVDREGVLEREKKGVDREIR